MRYADMGRDLREVTIHCPTQECVVDVVGLTVEHEAEIVEIVKRIRFPGYRAVIRCRDPQAAANFLLAYIQADQRLRGSSNSRT